MGSELERSFMPACKKRARREIQHATCIRAVSELAKQTFVERGIAPKKSKSCSLPSISSALDPFKKRMTHFGCWRYCRSIRVKAHTTCSKAFEKAAIPRSESVIIGATGDHWSKAILHQFLARQKNIRVQTADVFTQPIEETYGQASVLVHPAIEDGFALAVAQALACGKPVIATRQTGASQLITDSRTGYVLECRDVDGLVDRLRLLAGDQGLLARLSAAAPQAVAHLGYPAFAQNVARLYGRVLSTKQ